MWLVCNQLCCFIEIMMRSASPPLLEVKSINLSPEINKYVNDRPEDVPVVNLRITNNRNDTKVSTCERITVHRHSLSIEWRSSVTSHREACE